jgi:hypothetical protein
MHELMRRKTKDEALEMKNERDEIRERRGKRGEERRGEERRVRRDVYSL